MTDTCKFKEFREKCRHSTDSIVPLYFVDPITNILAYLTNGKLKPDLVTKFRLYILPFLIIGSIFFRAYWLSLLFSYLFLLTDSLDGQIARGWGITSKTGAFLDSVADRTGTVLFLLIGLFIGVEIHTFISALFLFGIIIKMIHLIGITKVYYYKEKFNIKDEQKEVFVSRVGDKNIIGKINSFGKYFHPRCRALISTGYERYVVTVMLPLFLMALGLGYYAGMLLTVLGIFFLISISIRCIKVLSTRF